MNCDKCGRYQREQHRQIGLIGLYYCCDCNGCGQDCPGRESNTRSAEAGD